MSEKESKTQDLEKFEEENKRITDEEVEVYCKKYLETFNRTEAYKAVHPNCTHLSAVSNGLRYYKYPKIQEALAFILSDRVMTTDELILRIAERARDSSNKQAQLKALELLARTKGLFLDRQDITTGGQRISWNQFINSEGDIRKDKSGITIVENR